MRKLIDKDDLMGWAETVPLTYAGGIDINDFEDKLKSMPTIYAEPVRHVKNIGADYDEVDQFVCSECGIELQGWHRVEHDEDDDVETIHEYRLRYCPNCGARMDEE